MSAQPFDADAYWRGREQDDEWWHDAAESEDDE